MTGRTDTIRIEGRANLLRLTPLVREAMSRTTNTSLDSSLYIGFTLQLLYSTNLESLLLLRATAAIRSNAGIDLPLLGRSPQVMNQTVTMFPIPNVMSNMLRAAYLRSPPLLPYKHNDEHSAAKIAAMPHGFQTIGRRQIASNAAVKPWLPSTRRYVRGTTGVPRSAPRREGDLPRRTPRAHFPSRTRTRSMMSARRQTTRTFHGVTPRRGNGATVHVSRAAVEKPVPNGRIAKAIAVPMASAGTV